MKTWMMPAAAAGLVVAGVACGGVAMADQSEQAEIAGVQTTVVTPEAAIRAAEKKVGGHALGYGYEFERADERL